MSWLKKLQNVLNTAPKAAPPEPAPPPKLPEPDPAAELAKEVHNFMVQEEAVNARAAYRDVFVEFDERHILDHINVPKLIHSLQAPSLRFTTDFETLKILPPAEIAMPDMERFWNNLRSINQPVSFDLVSEAGTFYFRLTVPRGHIPLVEKQLAIHFPDAATAAMDEYELTASRDMVGGTFFPKNGTHWFDITDVARDPYTQLFSMLDDSEFTSNVVIQVIFCPLLDRGIDELCELLAWEEPGIPPKFFFPHTNGYFLERMKSLEKKTPALSYAYLAEMCKQIIEYDEDRPLYEAILKEIHRQKQLFRRSLETKSRFEKKRPAWVACVNVFAESDDVIRELRAGFLAQYETTTQEWNSRRLPGPQDTSEHPIGDWSIVTTSELAQLAHFPNKYAQSERVETAGLQLKRPPDNFIVE